MWVSDNWKDYEIIDATGKEKLERWGSFILLRPDPQVIWNTPKKAPEWKSINARYLRSDKGGGHWEFFDLPETWQISCPSCAGELKFNLKPFSFKHTGLFPEQAVNWDRTAGLIKKRINAGSPVKVLNLFAYTGGATCAAALAGAHVTHVDASKGMTAWAKENAALCGVPFESTRWIVDDCVKFAERETRRGNKYDAVIMDPPSYGRGPKGEIWKMEDNIFEFIKLCAGLLSDEPLFFLINSYTTGLAPSVLTYMLESAFKKSFTGFAESDELGLPVRESGLCLPCGASGIWVFGS